MDPGNDPQVRGSFLPGGSGEKAVLFSVSAAAAQDHEKRVVDPADPAAYAFVQCPAGYADRMGVKALYGGGGRSVRGADHPRSVEEQDLRSGGSGERLIFFSYKVVFLLKLVLRGIYAARLVLFGIVDTLILTVFCGGVYAALGIDAVQLMVQFLLPMTVTAAVCFGVLCSRYPFGETMAAALCLMWGALWILLISNDTLYAVFAVPAWIWLFTGAVVFAGTSVYRLLRKDHYREVAINGNKTY